jgi:predicted transporter
MDAFSYLSVLLSIIIGLAIAQVLQGYRALLLARGRIHADPAPLIWSGLVLMFAAQAWWASFGLNARRNWDFLDFTAILVQMGLLYMLSALVLPDVPSEEPVDLTRHFERHRKAFFVFLIAMLASSVGKEAVLEHRLTSPLNLGFHALLALIAVGGIVFRDRKAQLAIALVATAGFLAYVMLLFARL